MDQETTGNLCACMCGEPDCPGCACVCGCCFTCEHDVLLDDGYQECLDRTEDKPSK